jgi:membrane protease YdiL (CAAX protease family)
MSLSTWTWAIALAVFMYGGSYASFAAFCLVALALFFDQEKSFREKGMTAAAVASFLACSWLVWQSRPVLATPPLHALPATLQDFLAHLTDPHAFMGIPLHGQWWIAVYYAVVLIFGNIAGEELWWRGFILPRQEAANGSVAWLLHGVLWAAFHLFFQATAWDMVRMMPTCCALAFVAQSRRNTWPGIIAHTAANSAIPIGIIRGIIS